MLLYYIYIYIQIHIVLYNLIIQYRIISNLYLIIYNVHMDWYDIRMYVFQVHWTLT